MSPYSVFYQVLSNILCFYFCSDVDNVITHVAGYEVINIANTALSNGELIASTCSLIFIHVFQCT